jgi:hypothetical protein
MQAIARRLSLTEELVRTHLLALEEMGIAKKGAGGWELVLGSIHLPQNSPMNFVNHQNWRLKACLDSMSPADGVHYTSVQSLSTADFAEIKRILLSALDQSRRIIEPSVSEELVCFNLDWFKL